METLQRTANRGSISTGFDIDNSLKLEQDNSEYLKATNTFAYTTPTSLTTGTFSCWVKRTEIGAGGYQASVFVSGSSARYAVLYFENDQIKIYSGDSSFNSTYPLTNAVFRDTSAWYHIVLRFDSTDSTAANRLRLYVNGEEQTWSTAPNITQDGHITFAAIGGPTWHAWGQNYGYFSPTNFFSGYLAEAQYIDGQALAPTEFGETDSDSGIWKPKEYDGTYGNAGYYLDFEDSSNLGNDVSGNGFDFDLTNITAADQATDTPTNNFATWNVNYNYTNSNGNPTITEGATKTAESSGGWTQAKATMGVTSGKWYWEYKMGGSISFMGVQDDTASQTAFSGQYSLLLYNGDNTVEINDTGSNRDDTTLSYTFSTSNIYAVALNMDDNEISYYQNGSIIGSAISLDGLADRLLLPYIGTHSSTNETNFGGYTTMSISSAASDENGYGNFEYAPPSGYYALCTKNLAEYG
jgi:hypothetical protein